MATSSNTNTITAPRGGELRYGFEAGGLRLVPAARVLTEMIAGARVFPVPKSAAALAGVLNLRGTIVPLLDPASFGKVASNIQPQQRRALVFDREEKRVGVLIEAAPELVSLLPASSDTPRLPGPLADFLTNAWQQADQPGRIWWEFNHQAAFEFLARSATSFSTTTAKSASLESTEVIV
jgi:chemotaxis signal transduction protein